ncbi:hypothetical protein [Bacillus thuringiensis]|uniref:hypothetical protein n=1 Tax=Bacillus thuringiensis TaxID=1428 RepID=UPI001C44F930|nr:hypothetical protein [Bacillus thuringiensis]MBV6681912.1 hypothetical protein [Bacillus thuringiensis]
MKMHDEDKQALIEKLEERKRQLGLKSKKKKSKKKLGVKGKTKKPKVSMELKTKEEREQEKRERDLNGLFNIKVETKEGKERREKFEKKSQRTIGKLATTKQGEQRRLKRYHERVWKGWDRKEAPSKVVKYNLDDLKEKENE